VVTGKVEPFAQGNGASANRLTRQPFLPKLPLTKYMSGKHFRLLFVFALAILFLAGQFHLCADTNAGGYASHVCPFCATAGSAIFTPALSMAMIPVLTKLEVAAVAFELSTEVARTTSPRAPPSLS
jgi:hypothetical protein